MNDDVRSDLWTPTLKHYTTYDLKDFQSTTKKLATSIKEAPNSKFKVNILFLTLYVEECH